MSHFSINGNFHDFLKNKLDLGSSSRFEPISIPSFLMDFQAYLVDYAIRKGRAALFTDCGTGKTIMELVWSDNIVRKTNRPVLILTPLAVSVQTLAEAKKFGIEAYRAIPQQQPNKPSIYVTNYEKIHHFNPLDYAGIVCDESSILKNFNGIRKAQITEFMRQIQYRLLGTATAAPNDWEELGTSSEALGYLGHTDMISRFFTNKSGTVSNRKFQHQREKHYLREHAKEHFWQWVASWARAARRPSDLGFNDNGFILPDLVESNHKVEASRPTTGMLFDMEATNFHEEREATRRTIEDRCEMAAEKIAKYKVSIAWCHLNDEAKTLKRLIPGSVEISGSDSDDKKEEAADWFVNGTEDNRVLISKPKIFGFGMNFQHCRHMTYFPTNSYEQYYQSTRRLWRFGQEQPVIVNRIFTNGGERMLANLDRKAKAADEMFDKLVQYMNDSLQIKNVYKRKDVEVPQWLLK